MREAGPGVLDEAALARRAANGDPEAFAEIVHLYQGPVYRLCLRFLEPADAEDAAQEAFVKAFVHRQRLDPERSVLPWLLKVARNLAIDRVRSRRSEATDELPEEPPDPSATRDVEGLAMTSQRATLIQSGLEALPQGQREAVMLFHVEGLAYKDIATALDVPLGTVMTWLHRARATLKKWVQTAEASGDAP